MSNEIIDKYKFTNCNECVNKVDGVFSKFCYLCKHFYGCKFEKREVLK